VTELWRLPAAELASLVRTRKASAREAAQAALQRLDAVNPKINAIVEHRPDLVLKRADEVDRMVARREDPGLLAGVPVTVKINTDQAGFATSNGTRLQRGLIAQTNSPAVDNLLRAGAVLLGRTNAPAFALRWFTSNLLHGATRNPRNPALTPGGSSGGGAAGVACGIGHLGVGTDLGGSVRYPAYACGIHGLRPSLGRIPAYNATSPEKDFGPQILSVTGPLARTIDDLGIALAAMSAPDARDPWWTPAPLTGPASPLRAAMCLRPGGVHVAEEVAETVLEAGRRLTDAGWTVEQMEDTPPLREADEVVEQLWFGDGFKSQAEAAEREGDPGALAVIAGVRSRAESYPPDIVARSLVRRTSVAREWAEFLATYPVLLLPVSTELPFPDGLDLEGDSGFKRVWQAQFPMRAFAPLGLPGLTVSTRLVGSVPAGVQVIAGRFRDDLCLLAGKAIEAGGTPPSPIDPL
jgi:amidase